MKQNTFTRTTKVKQVVDLHLQGMSKVDIAKITKIGRSEVTCILKYLLPQAYLDENLSALLSLEKLKLELDSKTEELTRIKSFAKKCKELNTNLTANGKRIINRLKDKNKMLEAELEDYRSSKITIMGRKFPWT